MLAAWLMLIVGPAAIAQDLSNQLYGSWRLLSFKAQIVGEDATPRDVFGPSPRSPDSDPSAHDGRLSVPTGSQATRRRRGGSDIAAFDDRLHRPFRVEGDKFITTVDGAWNEVFKSHEQVLIFKLEGDTLTIHYQSSQAALSPGSQIQRSHFRARKIVSDGSPNHPSFRSSPLARR